MREKRAKSSKKLGKMQEKRPRSQQTWKKHRKNAGKGPEQDRDRSLKRHPKSQKARSRRTMPKIAKNMEQCGKRTFSSKKPGKMREKRRKRPRAGPRQKPEKAPKNARTRCRVALGSELQNNKSRK